MIPTTPERRSDHIPAAPPARSPLPADRCCERPIAGHPNQGNRACTRDRHAHLHRPTSHSGWRTSHRFAIDTRPGDSKNAFPVRTGRGAVERAGLENRNTGSAPINATDDTAETYGDLSRDFHDAIPPDLRTDLELAAVVEAWPELRPVVRRAILELARDAARGC